MDALRWVRVIFGAMSQMPRFVEPMLAKLSTLPADQSQWAFEVKWDGIRAIARCEPGRLKLLSRNEIDRAARYPSSRSSATRSARTRRCSTARSSLSTRRAGPASRPRLPR